MRLYKISEEEEDQSTDLSSGLESSESPQDPTENAGENTEENTEESKKLLKEKEKELLIEHFVDILINRLWSDNFLSIGSSELAHNIGLNFVDNMEKIRDFLNTVSPPPDQAKSEHETLYPYGVPIKNEEDAFRYMQHVESFEPKARDLGENYAYELMKRLGLTSLIPQWISINTPIEKSNGGETGLTLGETLTDGTTPLDILLNRESSLDDLSRVEEIYDADKILEELPGKEADRKRGELLLKLKEVENNISSINVPKRVDSKIEELSKKLDIVLRRAAENLKDKYGLSDEEIKDPNNLAYVAQLDTMKPIKPREFKDGAPIGDISIIPDIAKAGASDIAKFLLISRLSGAKVFLTRNQKSESPIGGGVATKFPASISGTDTFKNNRVSSASALVSYSGNVSTLDNREFKAILDKYLLRVDSEEVDSEEVDSEKVDSKINSGWQGMYIWPMAFSRELGVFTCMPTEAMLGLGEELYAAVEAKDKDQIKNIIAKYKYNSYGVLTNISDKSLSKNNNTFSFIATPVQMIKALAEEKGISPEEVYDDVRGFIAERSGSLKEDAGELILDNKERMIPFPPEALIAIAFYIVRLFISTCRANAISTIEEYTSNEKVQKDVTSAINGLIDDLDVALNSAEDFELSAGTTKSFTRSILEASRLEKFGVSIDKLKSLAMEGISRSLRSGALLSLEKAPFEFTKQASFNREAIYNIATALSGAVLDKIKTPKGEVKINMTNLLSGVRLTDFSSKTILDIEKTKQYGKYLLTWSPETRSSTSETVRRSMVRMTSLVDNNCKGMWIVGVEQDKASDTTVLSVKVNSNLVFQNHGNGAKITIYRVVDGGRQEVLSAQASKITVRLPNEDKSNDKKNSVVDGGRQEVLSAQASEIIVRSAVRDKSNDKRKKTNPRRRQEGGKLYRLFITPSINFEYNENSDYELDIGQEIMYQARLATEKNTLDVWIREVNRELSRFNNIKADMIRAIANKNLSTAMEVMKNGERTLRVDLNRFRTLNSDFKSMIDSVMSHSKDKEELDAYSRFIKDYVSRCMVAISQVRAQILEFKKAAAVILGVNI
jgi:hypothetical protein